MEFKGAAIEYFENAVDQPVYPVQTLINGFAIEFEQNAIDIRFTAVTKITGFALELIDYPFYSFEITETRL